MAGGEGGVSPSATVAYIRQDCPNSDPSKGPDHRYYRGLCQSHANATVDTLPHSYQSSSCKRRRSGTRQTAPIEHDAWCGRVVTSKQRRRWPKRQAVAKLSRTGHGCRKSRSSMRRMHMSSSHAVAIHLSARSRLDSIQPSLGCRVTRTVMCARALQDTDGIDYTSKHATRISFHVQSRVFPTDPDVQQDSRRQSLYQLPYQ